MNLSTKISATSFKKLLWLAHIKHLKPYKLQTPIGRKQVTYEAFYWMSSYTYIYEYIGWHIHIHILMNMSSYTYEAPLEYEWWAHIYTKDETAGENFFGNIGDKENRLTKPTKNAMLLLTKYLNTGFLGGHSILPKWICKYRWGHYNKCPDNLAVNAIEATYRTWRSKGELSPPIPYP